MSSAHHAAAPFPLRLPPGADLRRALQAELLTQGQRAGFVLAGIGSLCGAALRLAGAREPLLLTGDIEILSLSGSLSPDGAHLHISLADADGRVLGGHVAPGCLVRTTAELLLLWLPDWDFAREPDPATGYPELRVRPRA
ncbi:DNA-binding protein [Roseateles sp. DAIF2]|uniref:PPC domain-containing DNA-binding protein n=1 Tax=Roseateles sp. DAIF2 TaxID=2714952 RepID=UPI0018A32870|nr:PPC domain-containing DNA-binding protein [Roseateles sp. DAIF2]QPF72210.1 DNA-binding protein [Roseateles sp. DAIF2]